MKPLPRGLARLLRWLEPGFRRRFEAELEATLEEIWSAESRRRGRLGRCALAFRLALDLSAQALRTRSRSIVEALDPLPGKRAHRMDILRQDLRYAFRSLSIDRGFAVVAILMLGFGIGANTVIFSAVNAELIRSLPYRDADRLIVLQEAFEGGTRNASQPTLADWKRRSTAFRKITGFDDRKVFNVTGGDRPVRVFGAAADADFFDVLGVEPILGRTILPEENRPGATRVVVLAEGLWRRHLGADPRIVGRKLTMNGEPYVVVGVMPSTFRIPDEEEVWVPLATHPYGDDRAHDRAARHLEVVGRLARDVSVVEARTEMEAIAEGIAADHPDTNEGWSVSVVPLRESLIGDAQARRLLLLMGAVGLLLLLVCVNLANLNLARGTRRRSEIALRVALGASRLRIARQLATESLLLAVTGGLAGLVAAVWGVGGLAATLPEWFPRLAEIGIDGNVVGFVALASIGVGVISGLVPALSASRTDLRGSLSEGRDGGLGPHGGWLRDGLVVLQVGVVAVLLVVSGLLARSFDTLTRIDPGFVTEGVLTAQLDLPDARYPEAVDKIDFFRILTGRLRARGGIVGAAAVSRLPLSEGTQIASFLIEGRPDGGEPPAAHLRSATPGYFESLSIPIIRGRGFEASDTADALPVAVVDRELAERHWGEADPLGSRIRGTDGGPTFTVVGVAESTRHWGPRYGPTPTLYVPHAQLPEPHRSMAVVIRTDGSSVNAAPALREEVWAEDPQLPISRVRAMETYLADSMARPRVTALFLGGFAGVALLLASLGIYGVVSYAVSSRTREIGIRMALGARRRTVLVSVVRRGLTLTGFGIVPGIAVALAVGRLLEGLLYGVGPADPITLGVAPALLVAVSAGASLLPALRATRVDPVKALRTD